MKLASLPACITKKAPEYGVQIFESWIDLWACPDKYAIQEAITYIAENSSYPDWVQPRTRATTGLPLFLDREFLDLELIAKFIENAKEVGDADDNAYDIDLKLNAYFHLCNHAHRVCPVSEFEDRFCGRYKDEYHFSVEGYIFRNYAHRL